MKLLGLLLGVQTIYTLGTAIWPLVHVESFMQVTGVKTDVWLVKTVGALLVPMALCLGTYLFIQCDRRPAMLLGGLSAVAFICIDFYYALNDVISNVYMADGSLQAVFLFAWIYIAITDYGALKRPC